MDTYQGSLQHTSILAQNTSRENEAIEGRDVDQDASWVMLKENGKDIERLPDEQILLITPPRVSLELSVPKPLQASHTFSINCLDGKAYVTNKRVIYLAARPTEQFKSFAAPILNINDTHPSSGGFLGFGAWRWHGTVTPTVNGGIPAEIPLLELTLTFNEGGMDSFNRKYSLIRDRLQQFAQATGQSVRDAVVHDEDLPPYDPNDHSQAAAAPMPSITQPAAEPVQGRPNQQTPDEPPPDYDEAQAQAVSGRFEERIRQEAERGE